MTPIERLTPEQLAERYPQLHPAQRRLYARNDEMRAAYEQWVTDGRPGNKLPPSLKQLFREPEPLVVSPQLYAEIEREVQTHGRRAKRKVFEKLDAELCRHVGFVPAPNRAERRAAAARKRRAK